MTASPHTLGSPLDADHLALDQYLTKVIPHGRIGRIFRLQDNVVHMQEKAFDRGLFAVDQGHHDLAVARVLARFTDSQITVQNPGALHGIALNPQRKEVLTWKESLVQHQAAVPLLLGVHGQAGRDPAHHRDDAAALDGHCFMRLVEQMNGAAVTPLPFEIALGLQGFEQLGYGRMADRKIRGRLSQVGQHAALTQALLQIG